MDEWMEGDEDGWMNGLGDGWTDGCMHACTGRWTGEWMDE